eukprot:m.405503 g.405503  ORF g.405503 m.405503 type:complete len:63 (+) comp16795_c1_seq5:966-1154(+)
MPWFFYRQMKQRVLLPRLSRSNYPLKWTLLTVNVKVDSCFCTQPRTNTLIGFVFPITCNLTG